MSEFWKREKHRVLAAAIIAMFVMFLVGVIIRQQDQIDDYAETLERIIDENNELKALVVEPSDRLGGK